MAKKKVKSKKATVEKKNKRIEKLEEIEKENLEGLEDIEEDKKDKKNKPKKKKMTAADKRRLGMQITGWIMALIMIVGVVMTFLSFFARQ